MFGAFGKALMKLVGKGREFAETRDWDETKYQTGQKAEAVKGGLKAVGRKMTGKGDPTAWRDQDRLQRQRRMNEAYSPFEALMMEREMGGGPAPQEMASPELPQVEARHEVQPIGEEGPTLAPSMNRIEEEPMISSAPLQVAPEMAPSAPPARPKAPAQAAPQAPLPRSVQQTLSGKPFTPTLSPKPAKPARPARPIGGIIQLPDGTWLDENGRVVL